jgi:hypothetical protein
MWKNFFSQLLNEHSISDIWHTEIHTAEPLVLEPSPFALLNCYFEVSFLWLMFGQRICPGPRLLVIFCNNLIFYDEELLAPRPTPKVGGPPLVGCPPLLIQYIRSNTSYLEDKSEVYTCIYIF